jgi:hypothetical protein
MKPQYFFSGLEFKRNRTYSTMDNGVFETSAAQKSSTKI